MNVGLNPKQIYITVSKDINQITGTVKSAYCAICQTYAVLEFPMSQTNTLSCIESCQLFRLLNYC